MATRDLSKLEASIWKTIDKIQNEVEREIFVNYKIALDEIRMQLGVIYGQYAKAGVLTNAEMSKFNRLEKLHRQLSGILGPTLSRNGRLVDNLSKVQYEETFYRYGWAIDQASGVSLRWGILNEDMIRAAVENDLLKIAKEGLKKDGLIGIRRAVTQGLVQGKSYPRMAKDIKSFIERNASGYVRIARTEGQRAAVLGQIANADKADELGVKVQRIWDATLDGKTRSEHGAMDGQAADDEGNFHTPVGLIKGPLQSGYAWFDINCFPGWVQVTKHTGIEKVYRRYYEGELITISTTGGILLTGTPNHPILTDHGWIALNELNGGINVVCNRFTKQAAMRKTNIQYKPTMLSEIFNLALIKRPIKRMPTSNEQFHGDGRNGYIDIVDMNGFLPKALKTTFCKPRDKLCFTMTDILSGFFTDSSSLNAFFKSARFAADRIMRRLSKALSFFWRSLGHANIHSFATVPLFDPGFPENPNNDMPTNIEDVSELFDRNTTEIFFDKIISINRSDFSGHVYNLQCGDKIYAVNILSDNGNSQGIVTHNCRCRVREQIEGYEPKVRRIRDEGVQPYITYSEWAEKKGLK